LPVTRYHSLAGTHPTLPDCLEVSSWTTGGPDGSKDIIMGVRHKELLVEGVQFHPESILTAEGRKMLKNFLAMQGGTWAENSRRQKDAQALTSNGTKPSAKDGKESILEKIYRQRSLDVEAQKAIPSQRLTDLEEALQLGLAPPLVSFPDRLKISPFPLSLMAEIKRASPSKGPIGMTICAPAQARQYAMAGASVISVLTEPHWFKGSIDDLRFVRRSLEGMPNRPAILRKEFILDEYQILEARLAGADTILLIVKMLDDEKLKNLYTYSKKLGMEPLVEVNTAEEMQRALKLGSRVIGVNNRDLTNFNVDLSTTSRLMENIPEDVTICALSGISGPQDVEAYKSHKVGGVLVGEALMRASNVEEFVTKLLGGSETKGVEPKNQQLLVKICGTRSAEAATAAIEAGADMIGIILVEGRKRFVPSETALAISKVVHEHKKPSHYDHELPLWKTEAYFDYHTNQIRSSNRALLVGVFQNQSLSYVLAQQRALNLDIVQLHGSEPLEWASLIPVPVFRRFDIKDSGINQRPYHALPLLDGATGGTGQLIDSEPVVKRLSSEPDLKVVLAGGLSPDNIGEIVKKIQSVRDNIVAVDVSSGVEENGVQSSEKIQAFIKAAKAI
jgi:anthranilate synthase / indole-3-glycerol phosphate synthase / phosphoribosylanthranilate isomerase